MSTTTYTPDALAEHHGGQIAHDALNAMLAAPAQAQRTTILQNAIALSRATHPARAAGGFSARTVNVIERGLEAISNDRR